MRVFFFWERVGGLTLAHKCNPYGPLMANAMAKRDIHFTLGDYAFDQDWLKANRKDYDVLHFNWVRHFYLADTLEEAITRYSRFTENLRYAKRLGYRIIWTMHNLYPHERQYPELDHMAHLNMCRIADHVIAHCNYSADLCKKHFYRTRNLHVIPHGNYTDAYPNDISQEDARQQLDISESAFVYLFFGNARPYKGIERLIAAFQKIENENAILLLVLRDRMYPEYVQKLANGVVDDPRVCVKISGFFEPEDFQVYLNAADIAVLPFVDVLTSGSAILALSFGLPVILPAIGCMPELIDESMGILFNPRTSGALGEAMQNIQRRSLQDMHRAAFRRADELNWDNIAAQISDLYVAK